ncbi:MAG: oligosaccharide flippase family protein [Clostridiaceae bacterium]|nr:oligosaccharide flippase family protein [Clostridiaceae bacterium]
MQKIFRKCKDAYSSMNVIAKASLWFILLTVFDRAVSLLTQPFINHILSVEEVGLFGIYQSWHSIFAVVATFKLSSGVLEVYITKNKEDSYNVMGSLSILSSLICLAFFALSVIFIIPLSELLSLKPIYIILMFVQIIGDSLISFWTTKKQFDYAYKEYCYVTGILFLIKSVACVFLCYAMERDRLLGRLLGLSLPAIAFGIVLFALYIRKCDFLRVKEYWKPAVLFNIPLIPHYLSTVLLSSSDKVMIEKLADVESAGLYTLAYSFSSLTLVVFGAINSAYNPFSMRAIKEKNYRVLASTTRVMMLFSMMFAAILTYLAPEGLYILGGGKREYLQALPIVPVLIMGIFLSSFYFVFSNIEFVHEKTKYIFPVTLAGALLNIGLNYLLIPSLGYEVAAYTTFIGYVFISVCHYWISRRLIKEDVYEIKYILLYLLGFMLLSSGALLVYKIHFMLRYILVASLMGLAVWYGWKNKETLFKKK